MKSRLLVKILNDTRYNCQNNRDYISIGSPLCHDLISVNKKNLELKYALDCYNEGRECLVKKGDEGNELLFIWDKIQELIDSGQIKDIIEGDDEIDNPIPVYTFGDMHLIESHTDKLGYPNKTYDGYIMPNYDYFPTKEQAVERAIEDYSLDVKHYKNRIKEIELDLSKAKEQLQNYINNVEYFTSLKKTIIY